MYVVVGFVAIGSGTTIVHTITPRFALVRVANAIPTTASGSIGINKNYREEHCHCEEQQHFTKTTEFLKNVLRISIEHSLRSIRNSAQSNRPIQRSTAMAAGKNIEESNSERICLVLLVFIGGSTVFEVLLHKLEHYFLHHRKKGLVGALNKIKEEIMLVGFISLTLTALETNIISICVPIASNLKLGIPMAHDQCLDAWRSSSGSGSGSGSGSNTTNQRRMLLAATATAACPAGQEQWIERAALHDVHLIIFFQAFTHISITLMCYLLSLYRVQLWESFETLQMERTKKNQQSKSQSTSTADETKAENTVATTTTTTTTPSTNSATAANTITTGSKKYVVQTSKGHLHVDPHHHHQHPTHHSTASKKQYHKKFGAWAKIENVQAPRDSGSRCNMWMKFIGYSLNIFGFTLVSWKWWDGCWLLVVGCLLFVCGL